MSEEYKNINTESNSQNFESESTQKKFETMMDDMFSEMRQGAVRTGNLRIKAAADMLRGMGYNGDEIREHLMKEYGLSSEEAECYI